MSSFAYHNGNFVYIKSYMYPHGFIYFYKKKYIKQGYTISLVEGFSELLNILSTQQTLFGVEKKCFIISLSTIDEVKKFLKYVESSLGSDFIYIVWTNQSVQHSLYKPYDLDMNLQKKDIDDYEKNFDISVWYFNFILKLKSVTRKMAFSYMKHSSCVSKNLWQAYLQQLHDSESSYQSNRLFDLATFFLSKKQHEFYQLWKEIEHCYGHEFWAVYWSDLLWASYAYLFFKLEPLKGGKNVFPYHLKKRLPFSFVNYDYKKYKPDDFVNSLIYVYEYGVRAKLYDNKTASLYKLFFEWYKDM